MLVLLLLVLLLLLLLQSKVLHLCEMFVDMCRALLSCQFLLLLLPWLLRVCSPLSAGFAHAPETGCPLSPGNLSFTSLAAVFLILGVCSKKSAIAVFRYRWLDALYLSYLAVCTHAGFSDFAACFLILPQYV